MGAAARLTFERGKVCGCFSINRSYSKSSLRSDVDCLTAEFASALSMALQRDGEVQVTTTELPWWRSACPPASRASPSLVHGE